MSILIFSIPAVFFIVGTGEIGASENEKRIIINNKILDLNNFNFEKDFETLQIDEKLELAPYLIDYAYYRSSPRLSSHVVDYLRRENHPLLTVYSRIAEIYFSDTSLTDRISAIEEILRSTKDFKEISLLRFHLALLKKANHSGISRQDLQGICNLPQEADSCRMVQFTSNISLIERQRASYAGNARLMELLKPYLTGSVRNPPFYMETAYEVPSQLFRMGFALEAGIFAGEMIRSRADQRAYAIASEIPFYLSSAGDFISAASIAKNNSRFSLSGYKNYLIDWMILGGDYNGAAVEINGTDPSLLEKGYLNNSSAYWMDLPPAISMQIKLAMSLYLAGDSKKAIEALEILTESGEKTQNGEPIKYYARLRLSQILIEANPILAQKIAEDVSYIAQENDWAYLEYHATVLDGWAQYFRQNYFYSVVSFIKAAGILSLDKRSHVDDTIRLLGLLAAYNKMNPGMNHMRLIQEIYSSIRLRPYNEAISFIKFWSPVNLVDVFLREASLNLNARGMSLYSLNYDLEFYRANEYFFETGKNPGGIRGYATTYYWNDEVSNLPYAVNGNVLRQKMNQRLPGNAYINSYTGRIELSHLNGKIMYIFPVSVKSGMRIYSARNVYGRSAYYNKRKKYYRMAWQWQIQSVYLNQGDVENLRKKCSNAGSLCLKESEDLRRILVSPHQEVRILYNPEQAIPFENILREKNLYVSYFYSPYMSKRKSPPLVWKQYVPGNCEVPSLFPVENQTFSPASVFGGDQSLSGGVLFFPSSMDRRNNAKGNVRPAYLRAFNCGLERYRLWDLDRFSGIQSSSLAVVSGESMDEEVKRVLARFITEKGGALLEVPDWKKEESSRFYEVYTAGKGYGKEKALKIAVSVLNKDLNSKLRIVFPSVSD